MPITTEHKIDCLEINEKTLFETQITQANQLKEIDKVLSLAVKTLELQREYLDKQDETIKLLIGFIKQHNGKLIQVHNDMATMLNMNKQTLDYFEETNKRVDSLEITTCDMDLVHERIRDIQQRLTALEPTAP